MQNQQIYGDFSDDSRFIHELVTINQLPDDYKSIKTSILCRK